MTANSSRRRVGQEPESNDSQNAAQIAKAVYEPLNITPSSTRFLTIQPKSPFDDRIVCDISEVAFGKQPAFEALSYRWGDEMATECILLNGVEWEVKQNLFDALCFLRANRPAGGLFWVDALCINQADKDECSAQVRMMRTIFFRASSVIVWLGKHYEKYAAKLPQLQALRQEQICGAASRAEAAKPNNTTNEAEVAKLIDNDDSSSLPLAKELYQDGYWNRVWIVQEVGLAAELIVCFGKYVLGWTNFIHLLAMHKVGDKGPLKLHEQRRKRHEGSCELLRLLHDYQDAQCQDPKDKVYGLIGLAADARYFPIDYKKSLFEIWKDVMEFAKQRHMLRDDQTISTGRLIKYLLMGTRCEPLDQILRSYTPVEETPALVVFKIPAKALGCVQYIGCRPDEIVSDPTKQERWEHVVQAYYTDDAGPAHAESDMLLRRILTPNGPDLINTCFKYSSVVQWSARGDAQHNILTQHQKYTVEKWQAKTREPWHSSESEKLHESLTGGVRLYQLDGFSRRMDWKMGVASDQVRLGDLICWVASSHMAIILRPKFGAIADQWILQAAGTAAVAKDLRGISPEEHLCRYNNFPYPGQDNNDRTLTLHLDATFVFILLESGREFEA